MEHNISDKYTCGSQIMSGSQQKVTLVRNPPQAEFVNDMYQNQANCSLCDTVCILTTTHPSFSLMRSLGTPTKVESFLVYHTIDSQEEATILELYQGRCPNWNFTKSHQAEQKDICDGTQQKRPFVAATTAVESRLATCCSKTKLKTNSERFSCAIHFCFALKLEMVISVQLNRSSSSDKWNTCIDLALRSFLLFINIESQRAVAVWRHTFACNVHL